MMRWRICIATVLGCWFLLAALVVRGDEDELISVQLEPSCSLVNGCAECEDKDGIPECGQTGFTQQYECGEKVNATSGEVTFFYRHVSCAPPMARWKEMLWFDIVLLIIAIVSLLYIRFRKQMAAYNLVSLVNRS